MFYKPDEVYSSIPKHFTDGTMSELSKEFNSLESAKEYFNSIINEYSNLLLDDLYTRYFSGTN